jgi:hypothetical protein
VKFVVLGNEERSNDSYKATTLLLQKIIAGKQESIGGEARSELYYVLQTELY